MTNLKKIYDGLGEARTLMDFDRARAKQKVTTLKNGLHEEILRRARRPHFVADATGFLNELQELRNDISVVHAHITSPPGMVELIQENAKKAVERIDDIMNRVQEALNK